MVSHWHLLFLSRGNPARGENVTVAVRTRSPLAIRGQGAAFSRHKTKVMEQTRTRGRRWDETGVDGEHGGAGMELENWQNWFSDTTLKNQVFISPPTSLFSNPLERRKSPVAFIVLRTWIKNNWQRRGCKWMVCAEKRFPQCRGEAV